MSMQHEVMIGRGPSSGLLATAPHGREAPGLPLSLGELEQMLEARMEITYPVGTVLLLLLLLLTRVLKKLWSKHQVALRPQFCLFPYPVLLTPGFSSPYIFHSSTPSSFLLLSLSLSSLVLSIQTTVTLYYL